MVGIGRLPLIGQETIGLSTRQYMHELSGRRSSFAIWTYLNAVLKAVELLYQKIVSRVLFPLYPAISVLNYG